MFRNWIDRSARRGGRSGRRVDRCRKPSSAWARELSRTLRVEPLESRLLLAADFDFANTSATRYSTGHSTGFVAAGDLDGINGTDLVVANDYSNTPSRASDLSVLLNNGQGVFSQRRVALPSNSRPQAVDLKDVDGKNGLDLVVAAIGVREPAANGQATPAGSIFVILNNGNGTFAAPLSYSAGDGPTDVVAANLDGQGGLDLVTANFRSNDISVLLEQAGGVMKSSRLAAGTSPVAVALGTINGDAHLDLAVANLGSNDISIFHGDGQGGFITAPRLTGLDRPSDLLFHDVDNDSDTDLVVTNSGSGQVSIFLNDGLGSLQLHDAISVPGAQSLAFGDLNHDGLDDLLVTSEKAGAVSTLTNLGAGNFSAPQQTVLDPALCSADPNQRNLPREKCNPQNAVVAQLNADSDVDVVVADVANGISVHLSGQPATISGRVFEDLNANGDDENGGDPGLGGASIDLYLDSNFNGQFDPETDQHVGRSTSAATTGAYAFGNVGPGTHFLVEQTPAGSTQTAPAAGGYTIVTQSGVDVVDRNFGNFASINISGRKFNDRNGDGDDENGGDPGMGGVIIRLYRDSNGNGMFDDPSVDPLIATRTTAAGTGAYLFAGNSSGTYFLTEQVPAGWEQTAPAGGVHQVVAQIGADTTHLDFGNHFANITISGRKFNDLNGDGDDENGGDPGQGGVIIELYRDSNGNGIRETNQDTLVGTATTATGTGAYSFTSNGPGTYFVSERVPAGSTQTAPPSGSYTITAQSGVNVAGRDFGNHVADANITISGRKFNDLNSDGDDENGGDPGLGGVIIELYRDSNGNGTLETATDSLIGTRTTATGTGAYSFSGNAPGTYLVREQVPVGSTQTAPPGGIYTVIAQSGVDVPNRNFGNFTPAGGNPMAQDDFFDVLENSSNNPLNVLANDSAGQIVNVGFTGRGTVSIDDRGTATFADDILRYTPSRACGMDQFTYTIRQGGVDSTATVSVQVRPDSSSGEEVLFCMQTVDLGGKPIESIPAGEQFDLWVFVQDTRADDGDGTSVDRRGVAAGYLDVTYDVGAVSFVEPIVFGPSYQNAKSGDTATAGLISEAGALQTDTNGPLGTDPLLLLSIRFEAGQAGTTAFQGNPSDESPFHDTLLFEPPARVPDANQRFVNTAITIVSSAEGEGESRDVSGDGLVTAIDVLLIVNELNQHGSHALVGEGETPLAAARFDTNRDGFVTALDALFVINHINSQLVQAEGEQVADDSPGRLELPPPEARTSSRHEVSQPLLAGPLPPMLGGTNQPVQHDPARSFAEQPGDRRTDATPPPAGEHEAVFATWTDVSLAARRRAADEIGSLLASDLSDHEFWRDVAARDATVSPNGR